MKRLSRLSILSKLPILSTLIVLLAVGVMIRLGLWQLERRDQKEALLVRYAAAQGAAQDVPYPVDPAGYDAALFHRSRIDCRVAGPDAPVAGHNARGATGWAHLVPCTLPGGARADVVLGWSRDLAARQWSGGLVTGMIAPGAEGRVRLIADPPLAGLAASAAPDPRDVPNNHLSYAVQWFLFAGVALVIYALALRKRLAAGAARG